MEDRNRRGAAECERGASEPASERRRDSMAGVIAHDGGD